MQRIVAMKNIYLITVLLLVGCASGSSIVVGEVREAIDSSQVMQYFELPDNYELIGIVTAPSDAGSTAQGSVDHVVEELKKQAAKLGANGIVILSTSGQDSTVVDGSGTDYIYTVTVPAKSVIGKAIYVE
jgi:ABC-type enterochelin transport system substrate-binding protein